MSDPIRVENMPLEEIVRLLASAEEDLSEELYLARKEFIDRIGGYENACDAVAMLKQLKG